MLIQLDGCRSCAYVHLLMHSRVIIDKLVTSFPEAVRRIAICVYYDHISNKLHSRVSRCERRRREPRAGAKLEL